MAKAVALAFAIHMLFVAAAIGVATDSEPTLGFGNITAPVNTSLKVVDPVEPELIFSNGMGVVKGIINMEPNDEARLMHRLIETYHGFGLARPVEEVDKTLNVSLLFFINEFLGIDELTGTMKVTATTVAHWQDDLLRWDPEYFNGLEQMPMQTKDIFMPTIVKDGNGGTQASIFMTGSGQNARDINSMVWVTHNGLVEARVTRDFLTACNLDMSNFPFDEQTCEFLFVSWRFNDKRVTLHQASGQKLSEHFGDSEDVNINVNPNWLMSSVTSEDKTIPGEYELFSAISYTIIANRRSDYYIWNVILPSLAMAVLLLSTFFMPFGPSRSIFCITLVLTMNIFQQVLLTKLPVTAEVIPYKRSITLQVMMGIAVTIESGLVWWIAAKDRLSTVPNLVRKFVPKLRKKVNNEKTTAERALIAQTLELEYKQKIDQIQSRALRAPPSRATSRAGSRTTQSTSRPTSHTSSQTASRASLTDSHRKIGSGMGPDAPVGNEEANDGDDFFVWGEWLEVAQFVDLIMLVIVVSCVVIFPIAVYKL